MEKNATSLLNAKNVLGRGGTVVPPGTGRLYGTTPSRMGMGDTCHTTTFMTSYCCRRDLIESKIYATYCENLGQHPNIKSFCSSLSEYNWVILQKQHPV